MAALILQIESSNLIIVETPDPAGGTVVEITGGQVPMSGSEILQAAYEGWGGVGSVESALIWQAIASGWGVEAVLTDEQIEEYVALGFR